MSPRGTLYSGTALESKENTKLNLSLELGKKKVVRIVYVTGVETLYLKQFVIRGYTNAVPLFFEGPEFCSYRLFFSFQTVASLGSG